MCLAFKLAPKLHATGARIAYAEANRAWRPSTATCATTTTVTYGMLNVLERSPALGTDQKRQPSRNMSSSKLSSQIDGWQPPLPYHKLERALQLRLLQVW
eukprot:398453-Amphidinium_carterae.1